MIIPIRCMSCGKPVGHLWDEFVDLAKTKDGGEALDMLKITRYCCRAQMLGHVDLIDVATRFKKH